MKTKEQTIHDMCFTWRHDYGLSRDDYEDDHNLKGIHCGMTERERKALYNEMSQLYDHHIAPLQQIIDDTLKVLPVGHIPSHTPDSIPDRVRYYVEEFARLSHEMDKLIDIRKPHCKGCMTNLVYYDGWHCECEDVENALKNWVFENSEGLTGR